MSDRERLIALVREAKFAAGYANDRLNLSEPMADYLLSRGVVLMPESGLVPPQVADFADELHPAHGPFCASDCPCGDGNGPPSSPASLSGLAAILKAVEEFGHACYDVGDKQEGYVTKAATYATVQALVTQVCEQKERWHKLYRAEQEGRWKAEAPEGERQAGQSSVVEAASSQLRGPTLGTPASPVAPPSEFERLAIAKRLRDWADVLQGFHRPQSEWAIGVDRMAEGIADLRAGADAVDLRAVPALSDALEVARESMKLPELSYGERILRTLLWWRHGCQPPALYGDDGELQCSACGIDFLRQTPAEIQDVWHRKGLTALSALHAPETP